MRTKHTPEPWYVSGQHIFSRSTGRAIATVWASFPEDEANAHLMSAAPSLLEALYEARAALNGGMNTVGLHSQIDAAIAKAEGRS